MIYLENKIKIRAPLEEVVDWLSNLPQHYQAWHPKDHIGFKALKNEQELKEGSIAEAVERIGKFTLSFKFRVAGAESDKMGWRMNWQAIFPYSLMNLRGNFIAKEQNGITELTAIASYGWQIMLFERLLNWIIDLLFANREAVAKHMREEGEYLKAAIESPDKMKSKWEISAAKF